MEVFNNDFCQIEFYPTFAILTIEKSILFNLEKATIVRNQFNSFYSNTGFILISNRKNEYETVGEVYKKGHPSNMKGLAIVSQNLDERKKAIIEQKFFNKPFAFFESLEDAKSWAATHFN